MSTVSWRPGEGPGPAGPAGLLSRLLAGVGNQPAPRGRELGAVLFDMDGLLIDSEPLWTVAEEDLAASVGSVWTAEIKAQCIGKRIDTAVPLMLSGLGQPVTEASVASAAGLLMRRMTELFAERLPLLPGALDLLADLAGEGVPCALVSSSYRVLVDAALAALGGRPFAVSIAGDEVERAKPDPQPYLLAAAALGLAPESCVVLEDSVAGARSGVAAGCVTVLVPGATVPPPLVDEGWTVAGGLGELSAAALRQLVGTAGRGAGSRRRDI